MPWHYEQGAIGGNCIVDDNGQVIADRIDNDDAGHVMSAAPELRTALELAVDVMDYIGSNGRFVDWDKITSARSAAAAAFAKCEGK